MGVGFINSLNSYICGTGTLREVRTGPQGLDRGTYKKLA